MSGTDWAEKVLNQKNEKKSLYRLIFTVFLSNILTAMCISLLSASPQIKQAPEIKKDHVLLKIQVQDLTGLNQKGQTVSVFRSGGIPLIKKAYVYAYNHLKKTGFSGEKKDSLTLEVQSKDIKKILENHNEALVVTPFQEELTISENQYEIQI